MKKLLIAASLALLGSVSANAADLAARPYTKAPVYTEPAYNWSGFYIGGDVGGTSATGDGTSNFFQTLGIPSFDNNNQSQSPSSGSFIGGVHVGYNWQFAPSWLFGLEGDWQWTAAKYDFCRQTDIGSLACSDNNRGFANISGETRSISTIRGRLGVLVVPNVLLYGTGGVAFADITTNLGLNCLVDGCAGSAATPNATAANFSTIKTGWVAGAGIEWMLYRNWTVRAEYLHAEFGNELNTLYLAPGNCFAPGPCGTSWSRDHRYDIGRVGFSYKFDGPATARY